MEIRFENKVAFITGAAGGIGYAAARMFAEAGASVVMADLDSRVTDRAKELEAEGHNAIGIRCDVSDEVQVKAAVEKAVAVFGKLDIAYNNVGIHAAVREDLAETEGWDFDRVISVNLRGVWNCMKYELVEMKKHGKGAIVNCSSQGGLVGIPCIGAYNASCHRRHPVGACRQGRRNRFDGAAPLQRLCRLCHRTDLGDGRRIYGDVINNK